MEPIHLDARAIRGIDFASLIRGQIPDPNGNIIPSTITSGSAVISGVNADNEEILVDIDAGSDNVWKATCWYYCISCNGFINALIGEPVNFSQGSDYQLSFVLQDNTGNTYDGALAASWSSTNTRAC